ncbi:uncharacterized protein [Eurosta solidaginis]|uniref:uncharacterized protein isoform X2 n=1 Tax=Eurosta solidaginis TaxID=178769 RepID=UPI00353062BA
MYTEKSPGELVTHLSTMAGEYPDIGQLPKLAKDISDTEQCLKYLPTIATKVSTEEEVNGLLQHIVAVIEFEITLKTRNGQSAPVNQVILNTAYRAHHRLMQHHALPDTCAVFLPKPNLLYTEECGFQMLYAKLLTDQKAKTFDAENLIIVCTKALHDAVNEDCASLLYILKVLNLLLENLPAFNLHITLQQIYHCLQSNRIGMRDESIQLFTKCCTQTTVAFKHFQVILEFWPWTNRYKYYLISCILKTHQLQEFLNNAKHSADQFYAGLRLSLSHKSLLAASQYLVKALSAQSSKDLLLIAADILLHGTLKEMKNFKAHWYARIEQKDELFEYLQVQPKIASLLERNSNTADGDIGIDQEIYRSILIFSMFSRQIFHVSKLHFFQISAELMTNCFQYKVETQMLIFKFIVDNLGSFPVEDSLDFTLAFLKQHKCIDNAQQRNEVLGDENMTAFETSIKSFFNQLHNLIEANIASVIYQSKIFSLRVFEILLKSLYSANLEKNTKNCSLAQNRKLGEFLIAQNIFVADKVSIMLFKLLNDPLGFDDALDLIIKLLCELKYKDASRSVLFCKELSQRCNVDECVLSTLYARATINCCNNKGSDCELVELLEFAIECLKRDVADFQTDPLLVCKTRNHLFGYINIVAEIVQSNICLTTIQQNEILDFSARLLNIVLEFLNVCKTDPSNVATNAASFQDMDESLRILVMGSAYKVEDNAEFRKFLLMSFWLTLKGACDLATEIGCRYVTKDTTDFRILSRCLEINVAVLTRCRHKGAIEAAGVSIGKLTKRITSILLPTSDGYTLLENCIDLLYDNTKQVSTTRRGAGYSIMMLHIIKNEQPRMRPILKRVMEKSMRLLNTYRVAINEASTVTENFDRFEPLLLHYLGVLVRDTELRDALSPYHNEILLITLKRIENPDWSEFNAALQLFGALIPKIVGQTPAKDYEETTANENNDITYDEIIRKLPTACNYILDYFSKKKQQRQYDQSISTRTTVLFLGFLSKVKHLPKRVEIEKDELITSCPFIERIRELTWRLLAHRCERVRKLAALSFVRAHDFRIELPQALLSISSILGNLFDENFLMGLLFTLVEGILRLQHESLHTNNVGCKEFIRKLRFSFTNLKLSTEKYKPYTLAKMLDIFCMVGLKRDDKIVQTLFYNSANSDSIGYDVWQQSAAKFES